MHTIVVFWHTNLNLCPHINDDQFVFHVKNDHTITKTFQKEKEKREIKDKMWVKFNLSIINGIATKKGPIH